jgi:geranylgeranyl diphosphate synthase type II
MHAAMLMHDDIIDRDYTRHGQLNVAGHYRQRYAGHHRHRPEHYAASTALLAGDLALAGAYDLILSAPLPAHVRAHAGGIMSQTVFTLVGGEFLDTEAVLRPLEAPDSLKIALLKTASYSFEAPLRLGALLARAGAAELAALVQYGRQLGVAFQLADDLLGLFGDESATGKPTDSDLAEGKITYLIQRAVALAPPSERVELTALLGDPSLTSTQLDRARQIVAGCGARQETEQLIEGYAADAERALAGARLTPVARQAFTDMITRSIHRSK